MVNFNALDLNLVRVFDALLKERSVTRAGARIGLSQPAVSAALSRLRHVFNDPLFIRQANDMVPTARALELGDRAQLALLEIEAMLHSARGLEPAVLTRVFTLLGADFFSLLMMPTLALRIQNAAPLVRLRLLDSARGDIARLLLESAVDMALERPVEMPDWVSSRVLFHSPFVLIGSPANPALAGLQQGSALPLDIFCRLPHAMRSIDGSLSGMVDEALARQGLSREVMLGLPHFQSVALAVAASHYIAAVPVQFARAVRKDLHLAVFLPPIDIPVPEIRLYWHARHDRDPAHRWMRDEIVATVDALDFPNTEIAL